MSEEFDYKDTGGAILVPVSDLQQAKAAIARFLQVLDTTGEEYTRDQNKKFAFRKLPPQTLIQEIQLDVQREIDFDIQDDFRLTVTFGTLIKGYYSLLLRVHRSNFSDAPSDFPERTAEEYLARTKQFEDLWRRLCEQTAADYGWFGNQALFAQPFWRDDFVLGYLDPPDVKSLINHADTSFWLTYVGPRLAAQVTQAMLAPLSTEVKWIHFPSGALFFRSMLSPLLFNGEAYYERSL